MLASFKWESMCKSKELGGLRINNLLKVNGEWVWKDDELGLYTMNSAYKKLNNEIVREELEEF